MSFLLDTNICSAAIRNDPKVFNRFIQHSGGLFTSRIVLAELYAWAYGKSDPSRLLEAVDDLLKAVVVLEFDEPITIRFGIVKGGLALRGISVPPMDLLIAATALEHGFTLVTHNVKDFVKVPGLTVVDWLMS